MDTSQHVPASLEQTGKPQPLLPVPWCGTSITISSHHRLAEQELGAASSEKPTQSGFGCKFISWVLDFPCAAAWLQGIPQHCFDGGKHL